MCVCLWERERVCVCARARVHPSVRPPKSTISSIIAEDKYAVLYNTHRVVTTIHTIHHLACTRTSVTDACRISLWPKHYLNPTKTLPEPWLNPGIDAEVPLLVPTTMSYIEYILSVHCKEYIASVLYIQTTHTHTRRSHTRVCVCVCVYTWCVCVCVCVYTRGSCVHISPTTVLHLYNTYVI